MGSLIQQLLRCRRRGGIVPVLTATCNITDSLRTVSALSWHYHECQRQLHVPCTTGISNKQVQSSLLSPSFVCSSTREMLLRRSLSSSREGLSLSLNQPRRSPFCNHLSRAFSHSTMRGEGSGWQCIPRSQSTRGLQTCGGALFAGHNKWSKVKHIKGPKDLEKSRLFTRIGIQLKVAVKEGGPNPETNTSLAALIALAKSKSMPKATIDSMIKKASTSKQGDSQQVFEVRGPANSSLLVTVLTDNAKRTRVELAQLASKNGGVFGEQGTAMFAFEKKGVVRVPCEPDDQQSMSLDEAEEAAIDSGAEEVADGTDEDGQNVFMFICDPSDLRSVRDGLAGRSLPIQSSGLEYVPQTTIALGDSDLESVAALINAFESHEQVIKVFDNVVSKD
ncbi:translational activator of cytochrome c oxidase 1-like [Lytechinus variegatus]|uniref:translational activator of cytochrome c oxidase 1-like n=1 Tax=Lytechinus variegatus TaxID=7654 RepID=UPI001BB14BFC|nr:translational activator of cytochrome c oxidase 1-like [Lytechinus variegatus]